MNYKLSLAILFVIAFASGCGPRYVPVAGTVFYDDEPAPDVIVMFTPKTDSAIVPETGLGITDSRGCFVIRGVDSKRNGLRPGDYIGHFGWNNNAPNINEEDRKPGEKIDRAACPYVFPKDISNHKYVFSVPEKGLRNLNIRITGDDIAW